MDNLDKTENYTVRDMSLAEQGALRVDWARARMPVMAKLKEEAERTKPLAGMRVAGCLHVTKETAVDHAILLRFWNISTAPCVMVLQVNSLVTFFLRTRISSRSDTSSALEFFPGAMIFVNGLLVYGFLQIALDGKKERRLSSITMAT